MPRVLLSPKTRGEGGQSLLLTLRRAWIVIAVVPRPLRIQYALAKARWREIDLRRQPKGHPVKVRIARQLRMQTPMNRQWIADRLRMGSPSYVSNLLASVDSKL